MERGQKSCSICPAGKFQKFAHAPVFCYDCPAGKYQDGAGMTACQDCAWGTVQRKMGQTQCIAATQRTGKRGAQESKTASRTELKSEEKKLAKEAVVNGALFQVVEKLKGEVTQLKSELAGATARSV
eukprot:g950.t1